MKDYTVRRYSFNELGEEAKERAITRMQNRLHEWIDEREITDYLTGKLEEAIGGESELEIMYSLSYSQGDGVALYGRLYASQCPNLTLPEGAHHIELIKNSWGIHYSHYNTFNVEASDVDYEPIDLTGSVIETQLRDLCKELERAGYKYIELATNRESAISYLEENYGDEFALDGYYDMPKGIVNEEALV
jgi:hypothetical protein